MPAPQECIQPILNAMKTVIFEGKCEQILTDGHLLKHKFECFDICDELLGFRWELVPYRVKMQLHNLIKASCDRVLYRHLVCVQL